MKNEIEKLNNYFVSKLLAKDYTILNANKYWVTVIVDEQYKFTLWIANTHSSFECYGGGTNFMELAFTDEEKYKLFAIMINEYNNSLNTPEQVAQRKAEFEKLKAEFEPTNN